MIFGGSKIAVVRMELPLGKGIIHFGESLLCGCILTIVTHEDLSL